MAKRPHVLGIVLAGGEGKRLMPLTADRAKPAVPFGGSYRLIDFVLSNLVNSEVDRICVLTQYKSHSLDRHISVTWRMSTILGQYVTPVPAQQRLGPRWFQGSADAIFQSLNLIYDEQPDHVVVFGADHVYRMDPRQMLDIWIAIWALKKPRHGGRDFFGHGARIRAPRLIRPRPRHVKIPGRQSSIFLAFHFRKSVVFRNAVAGTSGAHSCRALERRCSDRSGNQRAREIGDA
jgi:CTP:molybdopterin cytidylyltransferase MocA